jgi:cytoskeletal protein RodZ
MSESFGRYLQQQRELRAMSREEVARATRIPLGLLGALEEDRFSDLPGEAFVVGYIRAYAEAIGLNVDEAVLRFQEIQEPPGRQPATNVEPRPARPRWVLTAAFGGAGLAIGWLLSRF